MIIYSTTHGRDVYYFQSYVNRHLTFSSYLRVQFDKKEYFIFF